MSCASKVENSNNFKGEKVLVKLPALKRMLLYSLLFTFLLLASGMASALTVLIDSGAAYTNSRAVIVTVTSSGATYCRLSNDGTSWSGWQDYNGADTNYAWVLTPGDGLKTVHVTCKDANSEASDSNTITLDTTAPTGVVIVINDGNQYTNLTTVTMDTNAYDASERDGAKVTCAYSFNNVDWNAINCVSTDLPTTLPSGDGLKEIYFKATDAAGNVTTASDTIILDTTPPTAPTAVFPTSAITTISRDFQWQWSESDGTGSPIDYYLVTLSTGGSTVDTYKTTVLNSRDHSRDLNNGNTYVLTVVAFDKADNNSTLTFNGVTVDLNSPITAINNPTGDTNDTTPCLLYTSPSPRDS